MQDKTFKKKLMLVAIPIMLQQLLTTALSFLDTLMVGQLGEVSIAAVGIANQINLLLNLSVFGIASGVSVFLARFYGAKNEDGMEKVMAIGLVFSFLFSFIFFIASFFFPHTTVHIFSQDERVISVGVKYLKTVSPSYFLYALAFIYSTGFRSVGKTSIPLYSTIIALSLNAVGNYFLIFGFGPFPRLEVQGAAIATVASRFVETFIIVFLSYRGREPYRIRRFSVAFSWKASFAYDYLKICLPILCNELFYAIGLSICKVAYSKLGTESFAAISIVESIENVFFITAWGIASAATVVLSQLLGAGGEEENVQKYAKETVKVALTLSLAHGLLMALISPLLVQLFNISYALKNETLITLIISAIYQPIISVGLVYYVGIFRAGGDTRYSFMGETGCMFFVAIPLAFLTTGLGLPIYAVIAFVHLNDLVKVVVGARHLNKRMWMKAIES
ncbi:MAG: MATE family efflux transporter [Sphaerochaetaceae bacterium]|nr:MATE family efflux transporter [Sphaerochaetaceae bacterium]